MIYQNTIFNFYKGHKLFISDVKHRLKTFSALLIYLCLLLQTHSFAQPLAEGKNKFLGCSIRSIRSNYSKYWNQVTPEDAGKWGSVEGTQDQYNWAPLDNIYNYAIANGFPYKQHVFIWGNQYPSWITTLDSASQRVQAEEWTRLVGERYPGMAFADVVNEPFNAPPPFTNALGGNGATGWDWIVTAFQWARQYCAPGVKLILKEYNILHDNTKTDNYLRLIDTLRVRGLIDCIGLQCHYFEFKSSAGQTPSYEWPISTIKYNLDRLAATGLPIFVSEFDVNEADDNIQLQNYKTYFPLFWEHPAVTGVTLWGYVQYDIWKTDAYLITDRNAERPVLKWLRTYLAAPIRPSLISPIGTVGEQQDPFLIWHASDSATSYRLQVSNSNLFSSIVIDTTITDTLLQIDTLAANTIFYWHVSAMNDKGISEYSATAYFTTGNQIVSVKESERIPIGYYLAQNYPNPFNPSTTIHYSLAKSSQIKLTIYNMLGQKIKALVDSYQSVGEHSIVWDATDDLNNPVSSGIYFYSISMDKINLQKKMLLVR